MSELYILDTYAVVSYYEPIFQAPGGLTQGIRDIIGGVLNKYSLNYRLVVPSIVFIELTKYFKNEEMVNRMYYEVYKPFSSNELIMIQGIEPEILRNIALLFDAPGMHELHDKLVVASGLMFDCPVVTRDEQILNFANTTKAIKVVS